MTTNSIIKEKILSKIKKGQVKMRPKLYFIFKMLLFATLAIVVFVLSFFVVSFIIFTLKTNGNIFLFGFGGSGIRMFFASFPWLLAMAAVLILILLSMLAMGHRVVSKKPLLYSVLAILFIILVGGFLFAHMPLHDKFFERAQMGRLPMMGPVYLKYGSCDFDDFRIGKVLDHKGNGFYIETACGHKPFVMIKENTNFPADRVIEKEDTVMVIGREVGGVIEAKGIRFMKRHMPRLRRYPIR